MDSDFFGRWVCLASLNYAKWNDNNLIERVDAWCFYLDAQFLFNYLNRTGKVAFSYALS